MCKNLFLARYFLFISVLKLTTSLKCELKGLVDNQIQCLLHDRGINAEESATYRIGNQWISSIQSSKKKADLEPWRFSKGLDRNISSENEADFKKHIRHLIRGSRWCGDVGREKSLSYEDLSFFMKTDKCCKLHEQCNSTMQPQENKYGLGNIGVLKRFHCECEKMFYDCLKTIKNVLADKIGFTYFTVFGPQCFREEYPIVNCTWRNKIDRCVKYDYNKTKVKIYQWFDTPSY